MTLFCLSKIIPLRPGKCKRFSEFASAWYNRIRSNRVAPKVLVELFQKLADSKGGALVDLRRGRKSRAFGSSSFCFFFSSAKGEKEERYSVKSEGAPACYVSGVMATTPCILCILCGCVDLLDDADNFGRFFRRDIGAAAVHERVKHGAVMPYMTVSGNGGAACIRI